MASNSPGAVQNPQLLVGAAHGGTSVNTAVNTVANAVATSIISQTQLQQQQLQVQQQQLQMQSEVRCNDEGQMMARDTRSVLLVRPD